MKIIATSGPTRFLIDLGVEVDGKPQGQVIDKNRVFPQQFIGSIIARGYWTEVDYDEVQTAEILASIA